MPIYICMGITESVHKARLQLAERVLERLYEDLDEGTSTGSHPGMMDPEPPKKKGDRRRQGTGDRIGDFLGRLAKGDVKPGRRGAGSVGKRRVIIDHPGREKTAKEYKAQVKRIERPMANASTRRGDTADKVETGAKWALFAAQKAEDGASNQEIDKSMRAVSKHVNDDRKPRRVMKDAAKKLFRSSLKKAFHKALHGPKPGDRPGLGAK